MSNLDFEEFAAAYTTQFGRSKKAAAIKYLQALSLFGSHDRNKKRILRHLRKDVYARVGVSKIAGVGVIAVRAIPKGVDPYKTLKRHEEDSIEMFDKDFKGVHPKVHKIIDDFFGNMVIVDGKQVKRYDVLKSGPNDINLSFYMNHSDHPNVSVVDGGDGNYMGFRTNRKIRKGEELTIDYREYEKE